MTSGNTTSRVPLPSSSESDRYPAFQIIGSRTLLKPPGSIVVGAYSGCNMSSRAAASRLLPRLSTHLSRARSHAVRHFDYDLPAHRIALHPLPDRSSSKLLVVPGRDAPVQHSRFSDLPSLLPSDSLLVLNSSRVIPARLRMRKATGAAAELMLLSPLSCKDPAAAMADSVTGQVWKGYIGGRRVRVGDVLQVAVDGTDQAVLEATVLRREGQTGEVRLGVEGDNKGVESMSLGEALERAGKTPLPPYIKREAVDADKDGYQTVYAKLDGSVATPTAGLHVTEGVLAELRERGVRTEQVALHVGAGTFAPVDADDVGGHVMHEERISVMGSSLRGVGKQLEMGRPVVALGTTSVRTLESMYWFGVRLLSEINVPEHKELFVGQWEPYERLDEAGGQELPSAAEAIYAMIDWNGDRAGPLFGRTQLLIVPGYPFKMVDALVTNFHQPRSTLLMLVSAFHGGEPEHLFHVYDEALEKGYRFLSYGDSSIYADPKFLLHDRTLKT